MAIKLLLLLFELVAWSAEFKVDGELGWGDNVLLGADWLKWRFGSAGLIIEFAFVGSSRANGHWSSIHWSLKATIWVLLVVMPAASLSCCWSACCWLLLLLLIFVLVKNSRESLSRSSSSLSLLEISIASKLWANLLLFVADPSVSKLRRKSLWSVFV